jgi:indole-3-glycerol phosphate synthase
VEAHTADEVERALEVRADVIGVNSRDLKFFTVDPGVTERLLPLVPAGVPAVAESGVRGVADVERCAEVGADAVLVGTSLSRARDPEAAVRALTAVARRGRAATGVGRP